MSCCQVCSRCQDIMTDALRAEVGRLRTAGEQLARHAREVKEMYGVDGSAVVAEWQDAALNPEPSTPKHRGCKSFYLDTTTGEPCACDCGAETTKGKP